MQLAQIAQEIGLNLLTVEPIPDRKICRACCSDVLSDVMARAEKGCLWITHQTNENVLAISFFKELAAVIFAENLRPDSEVVKKANEKAIVLFTCAKSAFDIAGLLYERGLRGNK
ncbi:serine kinase [candidate division KSB1 bacterium]|nr:serine kinase [candidate division KSB1 bacterium]